MSDEVRIIDFLASADASDVHFRIVRLPAPGPFNSGETEIAFERNGKIEVYPGSVTADLGSASAAIAVDAAKSLEQFNASNPGRLIPDERFGISWHLSRRRVDCDGSVCDQRFTRSVAGDDDPQTRRGHGRGLWKRHSYLYEASVPWSSLGVLNGLPVDAPQRTRSAGWTR
jgi:hypothetical protein